MAQVAAIRGHVGPATYRYRDNAILEAVRIVGSVPLACDAFSMIPQPKWLEKMADGKT